mgnify:CR=1 FL=1
MTRTVTYQIGVDILGFPMYLEHKIFELKEKKQDGYRHTPKTAKTK